MLVDNKEWHQMCHRRWRYNRTIYIIHDSILSPGVLQKDINCLQGWRQVDAEVGLCLSFVGLVLLLGVVCSLGNEEVLVGVFAGLLHLGIDFLGTGLLFFGLGSCVDLGGGGGNFGCSRDLVVIF